MNDGTGLEITGTMIPLSQQGVTTLEINPPAGSMALVRLTADDLLTIYRAMSTWWSHAVISGHDHDIQPGGHLAETILTEIGELAVTLETPGVGGVLPITRVPALEPKTPKAASDKLTRALESRPRMVTSVLRKLHEKKVYLVTPWYTTQVAGTGKKPSYRRDFANFTDKDGGLAVASEVTFDPFEEGSWYSDVWPYPESDDIDWMPDEENGFSQMVDTAENAMSLADEKMTKLGWILL